MRITILMENIPGKPGIKAEHGLGMYIETEGRKIIMDTGQSPLTWENAKTLGVDPLDADYIVISHGHYDHAGGVMSLCEMGSKVPIYIQKGAGADFYNAEKYDGIDKRILDLPQLKVVDGDLQIEEGVSLFSGFRERVYWPRGNYELKVKIGHRILQDDFRHEQCLLIEEDGKLFLFSGCAHNGMVNILKRCEQFAGRYPDFVFSGFHMMKKGAYELYEERSIQETAKFMLKSGSVFYTGHWTSLPAFELMKPIMEDRLLYMASGDVIEL